VQDNFAYLLPFIMLTFGLVFLGLQTMGFKPARYWGIGYICAALGFSSPMLFDDASFLAHALISNILFFSAFFFYGHALLVQFEVKPLLGWRVALMAVAYALVSYFIITQIDLRLELAMSDLICAGLLAPSIFLVRNKTRHVMDKALLAATSAVVLETVIRVTVLLMMTPSSSPRDIEAFMASDYAFLMQMTASIFGFLMALAVLASVVANVLQQHRHAADHDPLTGLLNRRGFDDRSPDFRGQNQPEGTVLMCDIDHFKHVNDQFGHAAGDRVIIGFAELLKERLPPEARVARFGGEEFVVYLPNTTATEIAILANMLRLTFVARDWTLIGVDQKISASFGISSVARGDHSIHDAIARADSFLYKAKSNGRNQVVQEGMAVLTTQTSSPLKIISII
jgi:diguanylate cyclase (GGDEF)-like protein